MRLVLCAMLICGAAAAQYTLSAMAGYIHRVEGEAFVDEKLVSPAPADFLHVMQGQRLRVGKGRVEVMVVPGSFLRLGQGAEIEMMRPGLTSTEIRLLSGPAVVDLETIFEPDSVAIVVGDATVRFSKVGLYRFDSGGELRVYEGRARVESGAGEYSVKSKRRVWLGEPSEAERLPDDGPSDELATWQAERHATLAAAAEKAQKEEWDGMSRAERELLRMILRPPERSVSVSSRPSSVSSTNRSSR